MHTHDTARALSRRTILRGAGATLALPWLEAMTRTSLTPRAAAARAPGKPPVRFAVCYVPHGVPMKQPKPNLKERAYHWTPRGEGRDYKTSRILEPLEPNREHFLVLSGMAHTREHKDNGLNLHSLANGMFLTGDIAAKAVEPRVHGISVDQFAARQIGRFTPFPSLELGTAPPGRGVTPKGFYNYSNTISWRNPATPVPREINPRLLFDRMFRDVEPALPNWDRPDRTDLSDVKASNPHASVLDLVLDDAERLRDRLGSADRRKLDEYLDSVRAVEKRIDTSAKLRALRIADGDGPFDKARTRPATPKLPEGDGMPASFHEHVRLMTDLMLLAFQTDQTRLCTFMFTHELAASWHYTPELADVKNGIWHGEAHKAFEVNQAEAIENMIKISRYHCGLFNELLDKMKSIHEGDGTLLDNAIVLYGSALGNGGNHELYDLPILLAGRGGGTISPGRHVDFGSQGRQPLSNLYVEILNRIDVPIEKFGSSDGGVPGLTA